MEVGEVSLGELHRNSRTTHKGVAPLTNCDIAEVVEQKSIVGPTERSLDVRTNPNERPFP